jgi:hypothetical protein
VGSHSGKTHWGVLAFIGSAQTIDDYAPDSRQGVYLSAEVENMTLTNIVEIVVVVVIVVVAIRFFTKRG